MGLLPRSSPDAEGGGQGGGLGLEGALHEGAAEAVTLNAVHLERLIGLTMTVAYSRSELIEDLVLGAVLAVMGYVFSERYKRARGVTPWRLPSAVWAVLLFFLTLVGAIFYLIAYFTTRPRTGPAGWDARTQSFGPGPSGPGAPPPQGWNAPTGGDWRTRSPQGWDAPAPAPGRWDAPAPGYGPAPPPSGWEAPPPPGTPEPGFAPPGSGAAPSSAPLEPAPPPTPRAWLADPSGRHELRYWDGTRFTEHVADAGKITIDPL